MEFTRKKQRGVSQKVRRVWLAHGGYRIVWRSEAFGISVVTRFQAGVRVLVPGNFEGGCHEMWDFVDHGKHLYKTMKAAQAACDRHHSLWTKAVECTGIRAFYEIFDGKDSYGVPKWAAKKMNGRIFKALMEVTPRKVAEQEELKINPVAAETKKPAKKQTRKQTRRGKK